MINKNVILLTVLASVLSGTHRPLDDQWGFQVHITINHAAQYALPVPLYRLYSRHQNKIEKYSIKPDQRRYSDRFEGPRHYIDLDIYHDSLVQKIPLSRALLDSLFGESHVLEHGILPWTINMYLDRLTAAFREKDIQGIIRYSFELGHYTADSQVPLHTISNYNGQLSQQEGIHGLWETRLPQLFIEGYDLTVAKAEYLENPSQEIWARLFMAHQLADSVLLIEKQVRNILGEDKKYSFLVSRNTKREFSHEYSTLYHDMLGNMVERQIQSAIKLTANLWYTAWINAGMPDLESTENPR